MPKKVRDYKEEYNKYHGKQEQIDNRNDRNKARRELKQKPGNSKEVDHKKPLSKGGGNSKSNLRVTTQKANRTKYNK